MDISSGNTKTVSMNYHTVIPANATKIIATTGSKANSAAYSVYDIPVNKRLSTVSGNLLYTFSVFSDIHIDTGNKWYVNAQKNFTQALKYSNSKGSDYIVVSGDCVANDFGFDEEWDIYQKLISTGDFLNPIWESDGNHDLRQGVESGLNGFVAATGTDGSQSGKPYYYMVEEKTGDIFLFMALEISKDPNKSNEFYDDQLEWATNIIQNNYQDKNIFIVQHAPLKGFGAGDRMEKPYYSGLLNPEYPSNAAFMNLLKSYPNVTFLSGHTHEDLDMEYNFADTYENRKVANMIHTPALAGSTKADKEDKELDRNHGVGFNSQGYYVQVFENEIVFNGANITDEKIYPQYSYIMEGSRTSSSPTLPEKPGIQMTGQSVSASEELSKVSSILSKYYKFSSYDSYQRLRKLYSEYKNSASFDKAVLDEFEARVNDLAEYTGEIVVHPLRDTYYFKNNKKWSKVYAYAWTKNGSETTAKNGAWPGVQISKVDVSDDNYDIYEVHFDSAGQYENLIFNQGDNNAQTADIVLSKYKNNGFYITGSSNKYSVGSFDYKTAVVVPELVNNSSVSKTEVNLGEKVDLTAAAEGGTAPYTYAFYFRKNGSNDWTVKGTEFGTATSAALTPGTKTNYEVLIKVMDSTYAIKSKSFTITVK